MSISLILASGLTLAFAGAAYALKGVTVSGALAGAVVCFTLYAAAGTGAFLALVSVFVLTWIATRFGYSRKQTMGTAERGEGRNAFQVLANLGVATISAGSYSVFHHDAIFLLAMTAALSEAAADTVSSELGQACATRARLITTFKPVPTGTDGGITLIGTVAALGTAAVVAMICAAVHLIPLRWIPIALLAAFGGTLADSFLGAILERRGYLGNDAVNFTSTAVAAAVSVLLLG